MSTQAEILDVHKQETDFKLKPHKVWIPRREGMQKAPLTATLKEILGADLHAKLREMLLVP